MRRVERQHVGPINSLDRIADTLRSHLGTMIAKRETLYLAPRILAQTKHYHQTSTSGFHVRRSCFGIIILAGWALLERNEVALPEKRFSLHRSLTIGGSRTTNK